MISKWELSNATSDLNPKLSILTSTWQKYSIHFQEDLCMMSGLKEHNIQKHFNLKIMFSITTDHHLAFFKIQTRSYIFVLQTIIMPVSFTFHIIQNSWIPPPTKAKRAFKNLTQCARQYSSLKNIHSQPIRGNTIIQLKWNPSVTQYTA